MLTKGHLKREEGYLGNEEGKERVEKRRGNKGMGVRNRWIIE